jgi:hypothetical protein
MHNAWPSHSKPLGCGGLLASCERQAPQLRRANAAGALAAAARERAPPPSPPTTATTAKGERRWWWGVPCPHHGEEGGPQGRSISAACALGTAGAMTRARKRSALADSGARLGGPRQRAAAPGAVALRFTSRPTQDAPRRIYVACLLEPADQPALHARTAGVRAARVAKPTFS